MGKDLGYVTRPMCGPEIRQSLRSFSMTAPGVVHSLTLRAMVARWFWCLIDVGPNRKRFRK